MQLIIDIPKEIYDYIRNEHIAMRVCDGHKVAKAIYNGTPLYKDDEVHSRDVLDIIYAHTLNANALDSVKNKSIENIMVDKDSKESKQPDSVVKGLLKARSGFGKSSIIEGVTMENLIKLSNQLIDIDSQLDGGLDKSDSGALLLAASILRNRALKQAFVLDRIRDEVDLETRIQVKHYTNTDAVIDAILDVIDEYQVKSED